MDRYTTVYQIPSENWLKLEKRIAKLARKASKIGADNVPALAIVHEQDKLVTLENGASILRRYIYATLDGSAPVIDGWELIAVIDHTTHSDVGNLIRTVPGKDCPVQYRNAAPYCEHCSMHRRRNETFVLWDGSTYKQVGRNCLADFCRSTEFADTLCNYAEYLASLDALASESEYDDLDGMARLKPRYYLDDVLKRTVKTIRIFGWMSRAKAEEVYWGVPTSSIVQNSYWDKEFLARMDASDKEKWMDGSFDDADGECVEAALSWIRDMSANRENLSDYLYNLLVVCTQPTIEAKHFGLACSLIASYQRDTQQKMERECVQASDWFGTVKARATYEAKITNIRGFDSPYGTKYLVSFIVNGKDVAVWWSSTDATNDFNPGDCVKVTGSVKSHNEYKGIKQTELTRCKLAKCS